MNAEPDDFEAQWDDLDEKVILAQILTELQQIRVTIQDADTGAQESMSYECQKCGATVPTDARARHAREQHRAPPGAEDTLFTEVGE